MNNNKRSPSFLKMGNKASNHICIESLIPLIEAKGFLVDGVTYYEEKPNFVLPETLYWSRNYYGWYIRPLDETTKKEIENLGALLSSQYKVLRFRN